MSTTVRDERERAADAARVEQAGRESGQELVEGEILCGAYERLTTGLLEKTAARCDRGAEWPERIRGGLEGLLGELAAEPEVARAVMRSLPAVGPAGYRCYMGFLEAFVPFLAAGRDFSEAQQELPAEVEMLAIGAAETIVVGEIEAGRTRQLPSLLPAILFSVLMPFLGPEKATALMRDAGREPPGAGRPGAGV